MLPLHPPHTAVTASVFAEQHQSSSLFLSATSASSLPLSRRRYPPPPMPIVSSLNAAAATDNPSFYTRLLDADAVFACWLRASQTQLVLDGECGE
jgi:hypothetical protein